jgi:hypothetical protein
MKVPGNCLETTHCQDDSLPLSDIGAAQTSAVVGFRRRFQVREVLTPGWERLGDQTKETVLFY